MPSLKRVVSSVPESAQTQRCRSSGRGLRRGGIVLLYIILSAGTSSPGPVIPQGKDPQSARVRQFIEQYKVVRIERDARGFVQNVKGALSAPLGDGSPEQAVFQFLRINKDVLGISEPEKDLRLIQGGGISPVTGWRHLRFQQYYHGLEVYGGQLIAQFDRSGILHIIYNTPYLTIDTPTSPAVSRVAAKGIVATDAGAGDPRRVSDGELIIYPRDSTCYLAWHMWIRPGGEYFVDALSGRMIYHWSGTRFSSPPGAVPQQGPSPDSGDSAMRGGHGPGLGPDILRLLHDAEYAKDVRSQRHRNWSGTRSLN